MWSFYLSFAFILSTIVTMCAPSTLKQNLWEQLTPKEKQYYDNIVVMRRNIYFQGLGLGIFIAMVLLYFCFPMKKRKNENKIMLLWVAISITFVVNYFYYILYPKDKYMIDILNTKEENKAWLTIYKSMQFRYHIGFLLGLGAAACIHHYMIFK